MYIVPYEPISIKNKENYVNIKVYRCVRLGIENDLERHIPKIVNSLRVKLSLKF